MKLWLLFVKISSHFLHSTSFFCNCFASQRTIQNKIINPSSAFFVIDIIIIYYECHSKGRKALQFLIGQRYLEQSIVSLLLKDVFWMLIPKIELISSELLCLFRLSQYQYSGNYQKAAIAVCWDIFWIGEVFQGAPKTFFSFFLFFYMFRLSQKIPLLSNTTSYVRMIQTVWYKSINKALHISNNTTWAASSTASVVLPALSHRIEPETIFKTSLILWVWCFVLCQHLEVGNFFFCSDFYLFKYLIETEAEPKLYFDINEWT